MIMFKKGGRRVCCCHNQRNWLFQERLLVCPSALLLFSTRTLTTTPLGLNKTPWWWFSDSVPSSTTESRWMTISIYMISITNVLFVRIVSQNRSHTFLCMFLLKMNLITPISTPTTSDTKWPGFMKFANLAAVVFFSVLPIPDFVTIFSFCSTGRLNIPMPTSSCVMPTAVLEYRKQGSWPSSKPLDLNLMWEGQWQFDLCYLVYPCVNSPDQTLQLLYDFIVFLLSFNRTYVFYFAASAKWTLAAMGSSGMTTAKTRNTMDFLLL